MKKLMGKLGQLLELGGTRKDITFLVISGIALIISLFDFLPLPINAVWVAIFLCGVPIILEAIIGLVKPDFLNDAQFSCHSPCHYRNIKSCHWCFGT